MTKPSTQPEFITLRRDALRQVVFTAVRLVRKSISYQPVAITPTVDRIEAAIIAAGVEVRDEAQIAADAIAEHEAAICPEDVGCAELVESLTARLDRTEAELRRLVSAPLPASARTEEVERLKDILHRDRSGLAHALNEVIRTANGYAWITEGAAPTPTMMTSTGKRPGA